MKDHIHGIPGLVKALESPGDWEWFDHAAGTAGEWKELAPLSAMSLSWFAERDWRRKPEPVRHPLRDEHTITIERYLVDAPRRNGLRLTAVADDDSPWRGVKARITVEEVRDGEEKRPDAPGTIISWQEAQLRVDAGLAVDYHAGDERWSRIVSLVPSEWPEYTYRIPLQPGEAAKRPEAVTEMSAERATDWLRRNGLAVMCVNDTVIWRASDVTSGSLPDEPCFYVPLLPATRSQVEMAAENARLKEELDSLPRLNLKQGLELNATKELLDSAIGSRDAAVAALDQERMHKNWLRNALEMCAKYFGSASVDDLRQHIAKTLRDIDETAGKGPR